jgi:hypothetical protein
VALLYEFRTQTGSLSAFWISEKGKTNSEKSGSAAFATHGFQHLPSQTLSCADGCSRLYDAAFEIHSHGVKNS